MDKSKPRRSGVCRAVDARGATVATCCWVVGVELQRCRLVPESLEVPVLQQITLFLAEADIPGLAVNCVPLASW
ncbi:hypothetical protein D3C73_1472700 [compost metagenome]